jgi:two-component system, LuxR family, sensor kinase FixL
MWAGSLSTPEGHTRGTSLSAAPRFGLAALSLLAYLGLDWVSFIHEHKGLPVTPWNPGLGFLFAIIALHGPSFGIVLFGGVAIAELFLLRASLAWPVTLGIAGIIATTYAVAGSLARNSLDISLARVRDMIVLLAVGAIGGLTAAILIGVLLSTAAQFDRHDLMQSVVPLFVGDLIGIAVITPLVLRFAENYRHNLQRSKWAIAEVAAYGGVAAVAIWIVVRWGDGEDYKFFTMLFLPVLTAALRYGIDGACFTLAVTQFSLVGILSLYGYSATAFAEFQVLMLVLTMAGLLVGVVVSEREQAQAFARHAEANLKQLQAESAQVMRINMVSGMASALAHEISQPITAVRALARSCEAVIRTPDRNLERVEGDLKTLVTQIDHVAEVLRRVREFIKRGPARVGELDVPSVIQNAIALARAGSKAKGTRIEVDVPPKLPTVSGDAIQLQQVLLNLILNALDAIAASGHREGRIRIIAGAEPGGDAISVSVEDNGVGVPEGAMLFQPLTSSKPDGLGLGLSICASIMEAHGGRIRLQSSIPGATIFSFVLPTEPGVRL